jgi:hypothetical protein
MIITAGLLAGVLCSSGCSKGVGDSPALFPNVSAPAFGADTTNPDPTGILLSNTGFSDTKMLVKFGNFFSSVEYTFNLYDGSVKLLAGKSIQDYWNGCYYEITKSPGSSYDVGVELVDASGNTSGVSNITGTLASVPANCLGSISGKIISTNGGVPIFGAVVIALPHVSGYYKSTLTNAKGEYSLSGLESSGSGVSYDILVFLKNPDNIWFYKTFGTTLLEDSVPVEKFNLTISLN